MADLMASPTPTKATTTALNPGSAPASVKGRRAIAELMHRRDAIFIAIVAVIVAVLIAMYRVAVHNSSEAVRIHAENTQKAEEFKRRLIDEVPIGSPRAALLN
jgi:hypothetical protein